MEQSKEMIPAIFDSAFLHTLLHDLPIHPAVFSSIVNMLVENRCDDTDGFWNYFQKDFSGILPNDLDSTCAALEALVRAGVYSDDQGRDIASKIFEMATIYDDGMVDIFFPNTHSIQHAHKVIQLRETKKRVDIVVTCNLLRVMGIFKRDHIPELQPSFKLLESALDAMLNDDASNHIWKTYAKNYQNWDVICYFISRTVAASSIGEKMLKEKITRVIKARLCCDSKSTYMACRIMTALNVNLQDFSPLFLEAKSLLRMQSNEDYSFPTHCFYTGSYVYYFGSRVVSTGLVVAAMGSLKKVYPNIEELVF